MKTIIIEDEYIAAQALGELLKEVAPHIEVQAILQSIDESVEWLRENPMPELAFMDIHLADGPSFAIFDEVSVSCPVIFTTAYDEYALKAFEVNSIDYLLKPISKPDMKRAISKLASLTSARTELPAHDPSVIRNLIDTLRNDKSEYKSSLLVAVRDKLIPLSMRDIAYIHIDNKTVKAEDNRGQSFILEQTMDELTEKLNPSLFFRANRQFIISREYIKDISVWFAGKLAVNLTIQTPERIFISKARVKEFKEWITRS